MKIWSENELQFLRDNAQLTYTEIGKLLDRTPMGVRFQFRKHKITKIKSPHKTYLMNEDYFTVWSSEMTYILGFIFADGSIRPKERSRVLRVNNSDYDLLLEIRKLMESNQPIYTDKRTNTDFELSISRKKIVEDIETLGMTPNNSRTMEFPEVPAKYFFDFVRGYFDGDGHVKVSGKTGRTFRISFASGSKAFLTTLKAKLEERGIQCSMRTLRKGEKNESFQMSVLKQGRKLFYLGLYGNDPRDFKGIKMETKYQAFISYFEINIKIQCLDCGITIEKQAHNHIRCKRCSHERDKQQKRERRKLLRDK